MLTSYHKLIYSFSMVRPKSFLIRQQLGVRINSELIKKIKHLAVDKNVSLNILVEEALEDLLNKEGIPWTNGTEKSTPVKAGHSKKATSKR